MAASSTILMEGKVGGGRVRKRALGLLALLSWLPGLIRPSRALIRPFQAL